MLLKGREERECLEEDGGLEPVRPVGVLGHVMRVGVLNGGVQGPDVLDAGPPGRFSAMEKALEGEVAGHAA